MGSSSPAHFEEQAAALGLSFAHRNGANGQFRFPEIAGSGVGVVDIDGDGDLDLYFVQSGELGEANGFDQLFRNNLIPSGRLSFANITAESGITSNGYGMGIAVGDYDRDGKQDLYVTNVGPNRLYRNVGGGRFEDVTDSTGGNAWSTSAAFGDFNRDGWPDLFVANYVKFADSTNPKCYAPSSRRDYCGPGSFSGESDRLYLNKGDGTFSDATIAMLGEHQPRPGLGALVRDWNGDSWPDIYVANDGTANQLWVNHSGSRFVDDGLFMGMAVNGRGQAEASMGIAVSDVDRDGDQDVFLTHLTGESNTLYLNNGEGTFIDQTAAFGLAAASMRFTGWGTGWVDLDQDGWQDLVIANGAVTLIEAQAASGESFPFKQRNQAFLNREGQGFEEVTDALGAPFREAESSRGMALGDLDNDGDVDIMISDINAPAKILINKSEAQVPWIGFQLVANGKQVSAGRVGLQLQGQAARWRTIATDGSYASASDPRVQYYFTDKDVIEQVIVTWPNGQTSYHDKFTRNTYNSLEKPNRGAPNDP